MTPSVPEKGETFKGTENARYEGMRLKESKKNLVPFRGKSETFQRIQGLRGETYEGIYCNICTCINYSRNFRQFSNSTLGSATRLTYYHMCTHNGYNLYTK